MVAGLPKFPEAAAHPTRGRAAAFFVARLHCGRREIAVAGMDKPGLLQSTSTLSFLTQRQDGNQGSYLPPVIAPPGGGGGGGTPSLSVSVTPSAAEGGTHTITVTLSAASATAVTFDLAVSGSGANPVNAADFGGTFPSWAGVTIAAGQLTATRTFAATNDSDVEPDETGVVTLSNASGATIAVATAGFSVLNNDSAGSLLNLRAPALSGVAYSGQTRAYGRGRYSSPLTSISHKLQSAASPSGPWTDIPGTSGKDFYTHVSGDIGRYVSVLETASDGVTTIETRSVVGAAVQAMTVAPPAVVSNPMMGICGASFEIDQIRGSNADRVGWWLFPALFGRFMMGNRRIRHSYSGTSTVPVQPYVRAVGGASALAVWNQATALAADTAYAAESAHAIWWNGGSNTLNADASGGTSWLTYCTNAMSELRTAYPNAQIFVPEQMMRGSSSSSAWASGGYGRANVAQVNAGLGAIASAYGIIIVPWYARSGDPDAVLEGDPAGWAVRTDTVHQAAGRAWEMSRAFAAAATPYVADLGAPAAGSATLLTTAGASSGGTLAGTASGAVWAGWTLTGGANSSVVGSLSGDVLTVTATVTADDTTSASIFNLKRTTGSLVATTPSTDHIMRAQIEVNSETGILAYMRAGLSNLATLSSSIEAGAMIPASRNDDTWTLSSAESSAIGFEKEVVPLHLETPPMPMNRASSINVSPLITVESRANAGGVKVGQQITVKFKLVEVLQP